MPNLFRATPQPSSDRRPLRSKANQPRRQGILETTHRNPRRYEQPRNACTTIIIQGNLARVNRAELSATLVREGINPNAYSLDGGHPPERLVLTIRPGGWSVYYSERGLESARQDYDTEDEACRHLLDVLRRDQTTHFHLVVGPLQPEDADRAFEEWKQTHGLASLSPADVRVDNPVMRAEEGPVRRYWVRGTKLPSATP